MRYIVIILLSVFVQRALSQSSSQSPQGWLIYFGNSEIRGSKFSIHHEIQLRDHQIIGDHNQSLIRVGAQYQMSANFQGALGYGFIYSEDADSPNKPFVEHRIYQEAILSHPLKVSKIRHRFRLEERFIEGNDLRGRFRYCIFGDIPLTDEGFSKGGIYAAIYNEIFLNISNEEALQVFDRNRVYAGLGVKLSNPLAVQLGYMRQHIGSRQGTNHLLLSFHHKMKW